MAPHRRSWAFSIAVLPGDGIGLEVIAEGIKILRATEELLENVRFDLKDLPAGAGEYLRTGRALPDETFAECLRSDAILLGAMGLPGVREGNGLESSPQLDLRERLDLYCGLRPLRLFHSAHTPLKHYCAGQIDLLVVRENTEGLFWGRKEAGRADDDTVMDTLRVSRRGSERLFRAAFEQARRRKRKLTLVDKSNVLPSMALFRRIFEAISPEFPDVETEKLYIDAACLHLTRRPHTFDVIVTENMFGDILFDLAAALVGGMGMARRPGGAPGPVPAGPRFGAGHLRQRLCQPHRHDSLGGHDVAMAGPFRDGPRGPADPRGRGAGAGRRRSGHARPGRDAFDPRPRGRGGRCVKTHLKTNRSLSPPAGRLGAATPC